jgi:integrase
MRLKRVRLTKPEVARASYDGDDGSRCVTWDEDMPGFGLRVYPSGRKAYVLSYRHVGRKRLITIGDAAVLALDAARKRALKMLADVDATDPLAVRQAALRGETFADLAREYIEHHAKAKKRTWKKDESQLKRHVLREWGTRKAASITEDDVARLHRRIGAKAPIEANRTIAMLSKVFALGQKWGMYPKVLPNPARGIERYRETKRDRWITPDELPALAAAINAEPNEVARRALWLYLLSGARRQELLGARWDDIDFGRKVLRLPTTKAGRSHEIPLSAPALAVLQDMPRAKDNPFVFPGRKPKRPLVNITKPWHRVRKAAGVEDVRLHDLRRTVGSWLATAGNSLPLIGKVLNHSSVSTTAIYARLAESQPRAALEKLGEELTAKAGVVVALPKSAAK